MGPACELGHTFNISTVLLSPFLHAPGFFFKYCCQLPVISEDIGKLLGAPLRLVFVSLGMSSDPPICSDCQSIRLIQNALKGNIGVYVFQPSSRLLSFAVSSNNPALRDHQLLPALLMYSTLIVPSLIPASR